MSGAAPVAIALDEGWECAQAPPGAELSQLDTLAWLPARVPGTVAGALRAAGRWDDRAERDLDAEEWWYRMRFESEGLRAGERAVLVLEGLATVAEVYLNGRRVGASETMFRALRVDVGDLEAVNTLAIRFVALKPLLAPARRPRARWRTRLVAERNLRFFRTMLMGRAPGFAPGPAVVGPWRPVRLERSHGPLAERVRVRSALVAGEARIALDAVISGGVRGAHVEIEGHGVARAAELALGPGPAPGEARATGSLAIAQPVLWWPHTHGSPSRYRVRLVLERDDGTRMIAAERWVGFRALESAGTVEEEGIDLRVNGVPVFARGAVWTPASLFEPHACAERVRPLLEACVAAGFNMVRVPGTATYESDAFYACCDELGILVWQDFMLANFDYPDADVRFRAELTAEVDEVLERIGHRPSLSVLCGGSEVAQQAAMMGLDAGAALEPLYGRLLPEAITRASVEVPYVPSAPWGGELPFRTSRGVANYFGVGAYMRGLEDARLAGVRFAAECLAFANVPEPEALADTGTAVHAPAWKRGVPRDVGAGWDFDDVRDHYLGLLFGASAVALRSGDPERYLELSRFVSGEVMAEVFGEWRRAASPCAGGLVLWLRDLGPGAGWGVLDHRGVPKVAYHHLRRALAPLAVWSTDEGLGGVAVHVANDRPEPAAVRLRVALYRDRETCVEEVARELELPARGSWSAGVEELLGRFVDVSWAYRFGPPAHDLIAISLESPDGALLGQAFRHPLGRPLEVVAAEALGLEAVLRREDAAAGPRDVAVGPRDAAVGLELSARRFVYGVRVRAEGWVAEDDAFSLEPGRRRVLRLRPLSGAAGAVPATVEVSALNLRGRLRAAGCASMAADAERAADR